MLTSDINYPSSNYIKILFEWDELNFEKLTELTNGASSKMLRWLAMIHPDNRTRENLLRLSNIKVGKNTVINIGLNVYDTTECVVEIGDNCAIAANVSLIAESGPNMSQLGSIPYIKEHYMKRGKIVIEDHVWIGANVIVFPGVRVGQNSIVGAGSLVTKDIPVNSIVKGQPAKIFKEISGQNVIPFMP
jgi:acetyltransferase-like isoleucine patch superfamily enzyme